MRKPGIKNFEIDEFSHGGWYCIRVYAGSEVIDSISTLTMKEAHNILEQKGYKILHPEATEALKEMYVSYSG